MVVQKTPRLGLEKYSEGSDPHPPRTKFNSEREVLDAMVALAVQGVTSARPAAGIVNRLYWDKTVKRLFWDDGALWNEITTNGGGGAGQPISPGAAGSEGVSSRSARADHTHILALATASVDGAMSAADKTKLDAASSAATPGTLVQLDSNGRTQVASPAADADTANKGYVDGQVATRAASSHTHPISQISDATPTGETLIKATSTAAARTAIGLGSVNNTTDSAKPVSTATQSALNGKSNTNHTHSGAHITSGIISPARINNATTGADGLMSAADKRTLNAAASENYVDSATAGTRRSAGGSRGIGTISAGGSAVDQTVSFPSGRFTGTPSVSVTAGHSRINVGIQSINSGGFTFTASNWSGASTGGSSTIYWVAVQ